MRKSRFTFKGAYHHVMSRGLHGEPIFDSAESKEYFLNLLIDASRKLMIKIFAYCVMGNHYHLILQNTSDRLADFMRQVNGQYAFFYRGKRGGRGYVFQDRYKSTIIQKDNYLEVAISYVLLNPVRANLVKDPFVYQWSSINCYFGEDLDCFVEHGFVEELFRDRQNMGVVLFQWLGRELPVIRTRLGDVVGERGFFNDIMKRFNRRKRAGDSARMRKSDYIFEPMAKVISSFEQAKGIRLGEIDVSSFTGKQLRAELLVLLKERAGLRYKEIMKYPIFRSLKYSSLGKLYKRARINLQSKDKNSE